ncbi:hypothetical protein IP81_09665 [Novosphingobium sp. AAP83]|nr:hypothetical protein IP81_09665 [Novosphingobium sp. AAP83]
MVPPPMSLVRLGQQKLTKQAQRRNPERLRRQRGPLPHIVGDFLQALIPCPIRGEIVAKF